ncbi:MAG TPA: TonB-dependent receptor [Bryobacteraceae bacterium]|nr:TonB-dependent receptor [Bryobacteraceae bacterium]
MRTIFRGPLACCLLFSVCLSAAEVKGTIVDPSGARVTGARVSIVTALGVERTIPSPDGSFSCDPPEGSRLVITAPGFADKSIDAADASSGMTVKLDLAPLVDSVSVAGSALDVEASRQGGSVTVIPRGQIEEQNQSLAEDLLREVPGVALSQTGPTGGIGGLYIRGGGPEYNLVEIDGVPVNTFGGDFDFSHIPAEELDHVEVVRGPQSAVYGPYAVAGVVNFVTRDAGTAPSLDVVAEGGTYQERRFGISGGGTIAGFGVMASASQTDGNGPVANSDYRNQDLMLNIARHWGRQSLLFHGDFDSSENGVPGPYGSDPLGDFTGIDTISRNKNNFSDYSLRYSADVSDRVRLEATGAFFLNNNGFTSPYGFSFNKDLRAQLEARAIVKLASFYTMALGASGGTEQVTNTYITDANFSTFPIRRHDEALYVENRFEFGNRLFLNAGVRIESFNTGNIPTDGYSRPFFPAQSIAVADPKLSAAYLWGRTRFHASFGTGIRPPAGFDLAYTDNPDLRPERTRGGDAGVERRFFHDWLSLDATYFRTLYYDLIVILGGNLAALSHYQSDNLANSLAQGGEFSATLRPASWFLLNASYTALKTEILSLNGDPGVGNPPFQVGQELIRRPANSGALAASLRRGKATIDVTGVFRGSILDVEPTYGATAGLFRNHGYADLGIGLNYALGGGVTAYGNLRNALNQHYEEVYGFPSPLLNFVAGVKWSLSQAKVSHE